jgi:hypothetical protein
MKKLLKVILPPLVAFLIFTSLIKYGPFARHIGGLAQIGNETLYGLMVYFKIFAPLLLLTALLTQLLIIHPLWRKVLNNTKRLFATIIGICLFTVVLSAAISYIIWDPATGEYHLLTIFLFMSGVQVFYWLINFGMLFLLDRKMFIVKSV